MISYVKLQKLAGQVPGVPDGTGPYGRGNGPGGGKADGSGLEWEGVPSEKEAEIHRLMIHESIPYSNAYEKVMGKPYVRWGSYVNIVKLSKWEKEHAEALKEDKLHTNYIEGGLADGTTAESIAEKHGISVGQINRQLDMGIEVEFEHTNDRSKSREIAMDHLMEDPDYYTKLKKMEAHN